MRITRINEGSYVTIAIETPVATVYVAEYSQLPSGSCGNRVRFSSNADKASHASGWVVAEAGGRVFSTEQEATAGAIEWLRDRCQKTLAELSPGGMPLNPRPLNGGWLEARDLLQAGKRGVPGGLEFEAAAAVCRTDRIGCDPVDYYVLLPMCMRRGRLIVRTPRSPGGLDPGVFLGDGVPILARREMRPGLPARSAR